MSHLALKVMRKVERSDAIAWAVIFVACVSAWCVADEAVRLIEYVSSAPNVDDIMAVAIFR